MFFFSLASPRFATTQFWDFCILGFYFRTRETAKMYPRFHQTDLEIAKSKKYKLSDFKIERPWTLLRPQDTGRWRRLDGRARLIKQDFCAGFDTMNRCLKLKTNELKLLQNVVTSFRSPISSLLNCSRTFVALELWSCFLSPFPSNFTVISWSKFIPSCVSAFCIFWLNTAKCRLW